MKPQMIWSIASNATDNEWRQISLTLDEIESVLPHLLKMQSVAPTDEVAFERLAIQAFIEKPESIPDIVEVLVRTHVSSDSTWAMEFLQHLTSGNNIYGCMEFRNAVRHAVMRWLDETPDDETAVALYELLYALPEDPITYAIVRKLKHPNLLLEQKRERYVSQCKKLYE